MPFTSCTVSSEIWFGLAIRELVHSPLVPMEKAVCVTFRSNITDFFLRIVFNADLETLFVYSGARAKFKILI